MKISDELFIVTKDNKKGIINIDGNTILSSIYDDIKEYKDNIDYYKDYEELDATF